MKNLLLALALGACLTGTALAQTAPDNSAAGGNPPPPHGGPPPDGHKDIFTPEEHQKLRAAEKAAFEANPELKKEQEALQKKINAAMIKADPSVVPLLARIESMRKNHENGPGGPPPPPGGKSKAPGGSH